MDVDARGSRARGRRQLHHGDDDPVRGDLFARYAAVHALATALRATLTGAAPPDAALVGARRFGIVATADAAAVDRRADALRKARDALSGRLDAAPDPGLVPT